MPQTFNQKWHTFWSMWTFWSSWPSKKLWFLIVHLRYLKSQNLNPRNFLRLALLALKVKNQCRIGFHLLASKIGDIYSWIKKIGSKIIFLTKFNPKSQHPCWIGNTSFMRSVMLKYLSGHTWISIQYVKVEAQNTFIKIQNWESTKEWTMEFSSRCLMF
jgi:hypothetical protein